MPWTRGSVCPGLTLAIVQQITQQQDLAAMDRGGLSWANELVQASNCEYDAASAHLNVGHVTNPEVFFEAVACKLCSGIFRGASTETGDRQERLADYFEKRLLAARDQAQAVAELDTDEDGDADQFAGPAQPIGWNARGSSHRISGSVGSPSGKVSDATW